MRIPVSKPIGVKIVEHTQMMSITKLYISEDLPPIRDVTNYVPCMPESIILQMYCYVPQFRPLLYDLSAACVTALIGNVRSRSEGI